MGRSLLTIEKDDSIFNGIYLEDDDLLLEGPRSLLIVIERSIAKREKDAFVKK